MRASSASPAPVPLGVKTAKSGAGSVPYKSKASGRCGCAAQEDRLAGQRRREQNRILFAARATAPWRGDRWRVGFRESDAPREPRGCRRRALLECWLLLVLAPPPPRSFACCHPASLLSCNCSSLLLVFKGRTDTRACSIGEHTLRPSTTDCERPDLASCLGSTPNTAHNTVTYSFPTTRAAFFYRLVQRYGSR